MDGWKNITNERLELRVIAPLESRPAKRPRRSSDASPRRRRQETPEFDAVATLGILLGSTQLKVIVSKINAALERTASPSKHYRPNVTEEQFLSMLSVHILRAVESTMTSKSAESFYTRHQDLAIGRNRYSAILSSFGNLNVGDLSAIQTSLNAAFSTAVVPDPIRTIDESVFEYTHASLTLFFPNKPHPVGHVAYQAVTKMPFVGVGDESDEVNVLPFSLSFLFHLKHPTITPSEAFTYLVQNASRDTLGKPLWVADSAFHTADTVAWMDKNRHLYLFSARSLTTNDAVTIASQDLEPLCHRVLANNRGSIVTAYHGELRTDQGSAVRRVMTSFSNGFVAAGLKQCTCARTGSYASARLMLSLDAEVLKSFALSQGIPSGTTCNSKSIRELGDVLQRLTHGYLCR